MRSIAISGVTVRFGSKTAVDDVSLDVARGAVVCLLGPSGSGKSTLLRVVAGVERPTAGRIEIDGTEVASERHFVEPELRRVGMVFQDYALFPHLTVAANVAFGLRRAERAAVAPLLERLGLTPLANAYPHMLSGGERQRTALARAMAPQPRVLLMDEPFSSLDSRLRDDVRRHTLDFVRESGITTLVVTHDPDEAMRIADRIALLDGGRLVQYGTPEELYARPATLFAARFFGDVAPVPGVCRFGCIETALGAFPAQRFAAGAHAIACLRPQHVRLAAAPTSIAGRVVASEFCGASRRTHVAVEGLEMPLVVHAPAACPAPGTAVYLEIAGDDVAVVAASEHEQQTMAKESTDAPSYEMQPSVT